MRSFEDVVMDLMGLNDAQREQLKKRIAEGDRWKPIPGTCKACGHSHMHHQLAEPHRCNGPWISEHEWPPCNCPGYECSGESTVG